MAHLRQQIREAIVDKVTGLATTGTRVFESRIYPLNDDELPCLLVFTGSGERVVGRSAGSEVSNEPRAMQRDFDITVRCVAKVNKDLDDVLDEMVLEVEKALAADRFLEGLTDDLVLVSVQTTLSRNGENEKPVGIADMTYQATYWCMENTPDERPA